MTKWILGGCLFLAACGAVWAEDDGNSVVVIYNKNLPESKQVAEHYAARRKVPNNHLFAVDVSANELISRPEYRDKIEQPVFDWLVKEKLFTPNPKKPAKGETTYHPLTEAKVRYMVLCYGVPLRVVRDTSLKEPATEKIQEALRGRNEAAVDAELALLPSVKQEIPLTGPLVSPFYLATNDAVLHPTNGIMLVARLDGPSPEIARGLVDKALEAEVNGLWGRAYIDSRGITDGEYKMGDDWLRTSAIITSRMGFETELDEREAVLPASYPLSHVAFYAGWYEAQPSGAWARPTIEFMPGAFAYHIYSFSAHFLRTSNQYWAGPLLAKGATITMGAVDEPYLSGTPNVAAFLDRLVARRWTFGEAAYASQSALSWQTTVVGDPLYAPFRQPPDVLHYKLEREKSPLVEWSHARVVGLSEKLGPPDEMIKYLTDLRALTTNSAVLLERLGSLYLAKKQLSDAADAFANAAQLKPSPQQRIRLLNKVGELQSLLGREQVAYDAYKQLLAVAPDYPEAARVNQQLARLARALGKADEAKKFEEEAKRAETPAK